jgi:hypothetical protein
MAALVEVGLSMGSEYKGDESSRRSYRGGQTITKLIPHPQGTQSYNVVTANDDDPSLLRSFLLAKPPANSLPYRDIESRFFVQQFT